MIPLLVHYGLIILFLVVAVESFGIPLPGETALITCAILAAQGHYPIVAVIAIAAIAAIIGDNLGYWLIGHIGGRRLLRRWKWLQKYSDRFMPPAEKLMRGHGGKTVFFSRFVTFLRYTAAWTAGITGMPWRKFLLWNTLGGIVWATIVGLLAYFLGHAAAAAFSRYGFFGAIITILSICAYFVATKYIDKRIESDGSPEPPSKA